ncbi:MAG TPA: sugar transporter [Rhodospirillaceae bacterium]|nr:sugar transporter [Rhodospirillaceae bacterium]
MLNRFFLLLLSLPLAACSTSPSLHHPTPLASLPQPTAVQDYQIQPGDNLDIRFYYNPELNEQQQVRPDGRITLQLIGEQAVAGRTPHELETALRSKYTGELKQPEIAVIVRGFGGQKAYVDGEVGRPGMVDLTGGMTALQALAQSGGAKTTGELDEVILIRRVDGKPVAVPLDLAKALDGKDLGQDVQLRPYDVLFVPRSAIANLNTFIDQYFRQNVPIPFGAGYTL